MKFKFRQIGLILVFPLLALPTSCRSPQQTSKLKEAVQVSPRPKYTACVSLQGNGDKWPALTSQIAALMERDIEPVLIQGGSSGSLATLMLRGILSNKSLQATQVIDSTGKPLSNAQKAALITMSLAGPIETLIFLPPLNRLSKVIQNIVTYQAAVSFADAFVGLPEQEFAHLEAVTSQAILLSDFLSNSNFEKALNEPDFTKRVALIMDAWVSFADLKLVKPGEFINALLSPAPKAGLTPTDDQLFNEEIKTRYFHLFRTENLEVASDASPEGVDSEPAKSLRSYNKFLSRIGFIAGAAPSGLLEKAFIRAIDSIKNVPFIGGFAATARKPFYMPSHKKLWNAYKGLSTEGKKLLLPSGSLLYTTARKAKKRLLGSGNIEKTGLDNFYMAYYPSADLFPDVKSHYQRLKPNESFMQYPDPNGEGFKTVLDKDNLLILGPNYSVSDIAKVSIAEPGLMRRNPIDLSAAEISYHNLSFNERQGEVLIPYGGWLDHLSAATYMRFKACEDVDYSVQVATPFGNEPLKIFQRRAIRAVIDGVPGSIISRFKPDTIDNPNTPVGIFMEKLGEYMAYGASLEGKKGKLYLDYNWDKPAKDKDEEFNAAMMGHRPSLMISSYQHAARQLDELLGPMQNGAAPLPTSTLRNRSLFQAGSGDDVINTSNDLVGDLIAK